MTRFIAATAFAGQLYVRGVHDGGPWDASRLDLQDEAALDGLLHAGTGDRKVWTITELDKAIAESREPQRPGLPSAAMSVWVHESLIDELRGRWEQDRSARPVPEDRAGGNR